MFYNNMPSTYLIKINARYRTQEKYKIVRDPNVGTQELYFSAIVQNRTKNTINSHAIYIP